MHIKKIVWVKFEDSNEINYYDAKNLWVHEDLPVIVKRKENIDYGFIVKIERKEEKTVLPKIIRVANPYDQNKYNGNKNFERYAMDICRQHIRSSHFDIKLINAHLTFDGYKIIFYFVSEDRVDFRVLVRDLTHRFKIKVELKHMGSRDEARLTPSIGICGRPLCCNKFLNKFCAVSIQMAKDQGVSLHPSKVSGNCGRLLCCLKYEQDTYDEIKKKIPPVGSLVKTPDGIGKVTMVNVLNQTVKVSFLDENANGNMLETYPVGKVHVLNKNDAVQD